MPKPRLSHLHLQRTRHGAIAWYYRVGKGRRVRIRGAFGSPEFLVAYHHAALAAEAQQRGQRAPQGTLGWLIDRYHDSGAWAALSVATRRQRENIYKIVISRAGDMPLSQITQRAIRQGVEDRSKTPFAATDFLKAMRGLFRWALDAQHVANDPTAGVVKCRTPRTDGFHVWAEEEIERFEARWPIGTRERLALAILLYTGLRRGDAAMLGRQHVRGGVIRIRTEKGAAQVTIPVLPELAEAIAATKTGDLAFVVTAHGAPMIKGSFGQWFAAACKAAGVPGRAHGLRKAGATRAAENGATLAQLNAIYGWTGERMASHYTRSMDRAKLAQEAMAKLRKDKP
jgi:integrase